MRVLSMACLDTPLFGTHKRERRPAGGAAGRDEDRPGGRYWKWAVAPLPLCSVPVTLPPSAMLIRP